jgi:hypothetical protein
MGNLQSYKSHKKMYNLLRNNFRISNYLKNDEFTLYKAYKEKVFDPIKFELDHEILFQAFHIDFNINPILFWKEFSIESDENLRYIFLDYFSKFQIRDITTPEFLVATTYNKNTKDNYKAKFKEILCLLEIDNIRSILNSLNVYTDKFRCICLVFELDKRISNQQGYKI